MDKMADEYTKLKVEKNLKYSVWPVWLEIRPSHVLKILNRSSLRMLKLNMFTVSPKMVLLCCKKSNCGFVGKKSTAFATKIARLIPRDQKAERVIPPKIPRTLLFQVNKGQIVTSICSNISFVLADHTAAIGPYHRWNKKGARCSEGTGWSSFSWQTLGCQLKVIQGDGTPWEQSTANVSSVSPSSSSFALTKGWRPKRQLSIFFTSFYRTRTSFNWQLNVWPYADTEQSTNCSSLGASYIHTVLFCFFSNDFYSILLCVFTSLYSNRKYHSWKILTISHCHWVLSSLLLLNILEWLFADSARMMYCSYQIACFVTSTHFWYTSMSTL